MTVSVGLLQGFKLELSYGLVGRSSLRWLPAVDELFTSFCDERVRSLDHGDALWTNPGPRHTLRVASRHGLEGLAEASALFKEEHGVLADQAAQFDGRLMPTGMHPWMRASDAEPWPHGSAPLDEAMASLFGPGRHGYANQQALRLSIPFVDDIGFERVFTALRFVMPLMPALAASSPFAEGNRGPAMSCRVAARRDLFATHLELSESLVPRSSSCRAEYQGDVLAPLKKSLEGRGLSSTLHPLALCANGIVADFESGLVHVELLDMQECLQANVAVCAAIAAVTTLVQNEEFASLAELGGWPRARLSELLEPSLVDGEQAVFRDGDYAKALGFPERGACLATELWQYLLDEKLKDSAQVEAFAEPLQRIRSRGCLASRLLRELPARFSEEDLYNVYRKVCDCFDRDELL